MRQADTLPGPYPGARGPVIVAITGASGAIYGIRALQLLRGQCDETGRPVETHLIITRGGRQTIREETELSVAQVCDLADVVHRPGDLGAAVSSGSFASRGMLVAPCSVKTLSGIANCYDDNLVVRAADVTLKERRRLVLLLRETPLHAGHLRLMLDATAAGAIIAPPVPAFYLRPQTLGDVVDHTVGRALDLLGVGPPDMRRWASSPAEEAEDAVGELHRLNASQ
jgi:4-hydroxy-3-polyprenylbenzoate decarboxylase